MPRWRRATGSLKTPSSTRVLARYVAQRLAAAVAIVIVVSIIVFSFIHLAPGGAEQAIGGRFATPAQLELIRERYGLNDSLPVQYWRYLGQLVRGDMGDSITRRMPVSEAISAGMKVTAPLMIISFVLIATIGAAGGTLAAYRRGGLADRTITILSIGGASTPAFATATILLFIMGVTLGWLPTFGTGEGFADRARHLILPVMTLTIFGTASLVKITRARVSQVLAEDHVTFARARGLRGQYILVHSVLRNAGVQIVTIFGALLLSLIGGAILTEVALGLEGVGALLVDSIASRDLPVIQGITLLITIFIVVVNLAVDLLYFALDPRIRVQMQKAA